MARYRGGPAFGLALGNKGAGLLGIPPTADKSLLGALTARILTGCPNVAMR